MTTTKGDRLRGHRGLGGLVADTTGQSREDGLRIFGELVERVPPFPLPTGGARLLAF